jgi:general secretion pathway protein D
VILSVTPRINASGVIMLNIAQEVSSAQPNSTSGIVAPVISKSQFQTTAMLKDGQTLALGGIITTSNTVTKNRIPLLGDIPGLGLLFGSTGLSTARKELVLVITPHVSTDLNESTKVSNEFMNSMKNLKKDLSKLPQAK